jgi:hypothetical protein
MVAASQNLYNVGLVCSEFISRRQLLIVTLLLQMGWDLAVVLSALAVAEDGDIITEECSIGHATTQTAIFGGVLGGEEG